MILGLDYHNYNQDHAGRFMFPYYHKIYDHQFYSGWSKQSLVLARFEEFGLVINMFLSIFLIGQFPNFLIKTSLWLNQVSDQNRLAVLNLKKQVLRHLQVQLYHLHLTFTNSISNFKMTFKFCCFALKMVFKLS